MLISSGILIEMVYAAVLRKTRRVRRRSSSVDP